MKEGRADLNYFRQWVRSQFDPFKMLGLYHRLAEDVKKYPATHFVIGLPTEGDVLALLTSSYRPGIERSVPLPGAFIWQTAYVVNLDTLDVSTMEPPPLEAYLAESAERRKSQVS